MLAMLVAAVLTQTPTKVAIVPLGNVGLEASKVTLYTDLLAQELAKARDLEVTSEAQLQAVLGLERQRALLGCAAESCAAELAGAIGADALLTGSLAKVEGGLVISLRVVQARTSKQLAGFTAQVANEKELLAAIPGAAAALVRATRAALHPGSEPPPVVTRPSGGARAIAWLPAAGGGLLLASGAVCYGLARGAESRLLNGDPTIPDDGAAAVAATGRTEQTLAFVLGGAGLAALATAGVMFLAGGSDAAPLNVAVAPRPGGGALLISGEW